MNLSPCFTSSNHVFPLAHQFCVTLSFFLPALHFAPYIMECLKLQYGYIIHRYQPREIPHFGLFPASPHFRENVLHFWFYFEKKIAESRNNFRCTDTFCSKKLCENVNDSITYLLNIILDSKIAENHNNCQWTDTFCWKNLHKRQ